ncbi:MAG: nucleotidyl transferase AbiEii/AbiGii toxin family protein [Anaeromyxobacter sp.]
MKREGPNVGARARVQLLRLAKERGEDFQLVLLRYAHERLMYRLAASRHAAAFVLKGAALFTVWTGHPHRATRDLDLLGFGDPSQERLRATFVEVAHLPVPDDGVEFDGAGIEVGPIREGEEYGGVRVHLVARIVTAVIRLQIDVGFGDAITPAAVELDFPPLLDFPAPRLRAYPRETVVAEKLEAMVKLGLANSRLKDFYDLAELSRLFPFDGALLAAAIRATFERRGTELPRGLPVALTSAFAEDPQKQEQWRGFVRKAGVQDAPSLGSTVALVAAFAGPALAAGEGTTRWAASWPPGGPWIPVR